MRAHILLLAVALLLGITGKSQVTAGDCGVAINACNNPSFSVDPSGFGLVDELANNNISNPQINPNCCNSGCLLSGELNSTWLIINVATSGTLEFSMGASGGSGNCYDWIMWSYDANSCANIQNNTLPPVACNWNGACGGFTGMANTIPAGGDPLDFEAGINVTCGDAFIVCFSNYSSAVTSVPLNFFGSATISCTTFTPITVNNPTICPGQCAPLTANGGTTYNWAPSPDLSATSGATVNACPPGQGTYTYDVTGTGPCGTGTATATVTVLPPSDPACFTPNCNIDFFEVNISACNGATNTYDISGTVEFSNPPATGLLVVEDCHGNQQTFPMPGTTSPAAYSITGLPSDGAACDVSVYFTADPACTQNIPFTAQPPCNCPADAGTFTDNTAGSTNNTGPWSLCFGDVLNIISNGDNTDPLDVSPVPGTTYDPGIWLLVFNCPPTLTPPADINTDNCLLGVASTANGAWTITNNLGDGSTLYYVPITMYDMTNSYYSVTTGGIDCYDLGPVYEVTFLPQITSIGVEDCQAGTATVTLLGGDPQTNGTNFTISNLSPASASLSTTTVANNGTVTISGLQDGDAYSFDVTDVNGCPHTFTGGPFVAADDATINPAGPFCPGDPAFQMTSADPGGTWTASCGACITAGGVFDPSVSGDGNFTITYTIPGACGDTDTEVVSVTNSADATITPPAAACEDAAPVLFNAATNGGAWTATCGACINATTGSFDPTVSGPGTFTITYTIGGSCGNTDTETYTVNPLDDATITPAGPFCDTDPAVNLVGATAGGTWSGTGITNPAAGTFDPAVAGNGTFTIAYTTSGVCPSNDTEDIVVNSFLDPTINPAGPFCEDNAVATMAAVTPGGTWSAPCGACINATTGAFDPAVAGPGTWTISYTTPSTCGATDTEDVIVIANDDATINPAGPFCTTDPITNLTAADAGGTWSAPCGGCINAATGAFDPAAAGQGTWTITYTISGACGDTDTEDIIVNDQLDATINAAGPFCANDPAVILTAADPGGTWTATCGTCVDATTGQFNPAVAGPGTHIITYTLGSSCGDQQASTITVNPTSDASIIPAGPFCEGFGNTNITAVNAGGTWSASCGACIDPATGTFNTTVAGVGIHNITYSLGGPCPDQQTIQVQVTPNDDASFQASTPLCDNDTPSQLVPVTPGGTWSATCGTCVTPTGFFNPTAAGLGTHTVTYTIPGICGGTTSQDITVNPSPSVNYTVDSNEGCIPHTVNFTDLTNPPGGTYQWNFGDGNSSTTVGDIAHTYNTVGCFDVSLTVTTAQGCVNDTTIFSMVCVNDFAVANFTFSPTETTVLSPAISFTNLSSNASVFEWTFDQLGTSGATNPSFTFPDAQAGAYQVCLAALNAEGCHDTTCQIVTILDEFLIYVPNAFSPDGDDVNDVFLPVVNAVIEEEYRLYIFDRWGELIFESQFKDLGWDGTYKGFNAKSDVYVWKIVLTDNLQNKREFVGHVTLLR